MGLFLQRARQLFGPSWSVKAISFAHSPLGPRATYDRICQAPVHFEMPFTEAVFARDLLAMPMAARPADERDLHARSGCGARDAGATAGAALVRRHRQAGPRGRPRGARSHADAPGGSPGHQARTLQRRLRAAGITHRGLVRGVREDLANRSLATRVSQGQIARTLGYSGRGVPARLQAMVGHDARPASTDPLTRARRRPCRSCASTPSPSRSTATAPARRRASSTRSASAAWRCTSGSSRPAPSSEMFGREGGSDRRRRRFRRARLRERRRLDPRPQHVRPDPRPLARRRLEGLVGRQPAVPRAGVRADAPPARADRDGGRHDVSLRHRRHPRGARARARPRPAARTCASAAASRRSASTSAPGWSTRSTSRSRRSLLGSGRAPVRRHRPAEARLSDVASTSRRARPRTSC